MNHESALPINDLSEKIRFQTHVITRTSGDDEDQCLVVPKQYNQPTYIATLKRLQNHEMNL